ncbi:hypothetical protein CEUSTIGMA_g10146.t1 [Chlamydomonas eustigma]|uniref:CP12 domain-containing protein n=1 Tax=Chlamydomonas eustigma TaxID=1157962 RepID=A0A250XIU4_9CHLO|nr:hypothetical protein CEUSTIGMA_g10146.t1 [Chlamydomonas eustigma]|eukprot:GAX82720.1 hypothetical protein CEUSTIGMA_g10146.t1 [Chlamydomonas eustigma]
MLTARSSSTVIRKVTFSSRKSCIVRPKVLSRSTPKDVDIQLEKALKEANACDDKSDNCAPQWDTVEELSAAKAHMKADLKADPTKNDPLEAFCMDNEDADECRVHDN